MGIAHDKESDSSKTAILLAAVSYQTYPFFLEGKLILPQEYHLKYTIRASADVENPTEEVFGFIAESHDHIIVAFRGFASYPTDLLAQYDILQISYPFVRYAGKTSRGFTCIYQSTRPCFIQEVTKLPRKKTCM